MKIRNFIFGIALICSICFTSCSDGSSSSDSNDTSSRVLDLRIKKDGVAYNPSREIKREGENAEITKTDRVEVAAVEGGIKFSITPPEETTYILIQRIEENGLYSTKLDVPLNSAKEFIYPLCEPGEKYKFCVRIETGDRLNAYEDFLTITATDGIGDIDYSNLKSSRHLNLSYDGTKPTCQIIDCIPPEAKNVKAFISYSVTNSNTINWDATDSANEVLWLGNYKGDVSEIISSEELYEAKDYSSENPNVDGYYKNPDQPFKYFLDNSNKSYLFAQYTYTFELEMEGQENFMWRTASIDSEPIRIK
ncbi:hypothetical protein [uncultured Treponema sp.]|uniref:hypothetical protein n=1 Tax=uncultured Treponema sp. TaxID=162155 RepID=UPI000E8FEA18|nr:hypothetical protein [uncultured Treponema sp.]HAZ95750.1 hypothetical protein [Treponema sp.]